MEEQTKSVLIAAAQSPEPRSTPWQRLRVVMQVPGPVVGCIAVALTCDWWWNGSALSSDISSLISLLAGGAVACFLLLGGRYAGRYAPTTAAKLALLGFTMFSGCGPGGLPNQGPQPQTPAAQSGPAEESGFNLEVWSSLEKNTRDKQHDLLAEHDRQRAISRPDDVNRASYHREVMVDMHLSGAAGSGDPEPLFPDAIAGALGTLDPKGGRPESPSAGVRLLRKSQFKLPGSQGIGPVVERKKQDLTGSIDAAAQLEAQQKARLKTHVEELQWAEARRELEERVKAATGPAREEAGKLARTLQEAQDILKQEAQNLVQKAGKDLLDKIGKDIGEEEAKEILGKAVIIVDAIMTVAEITSMDPKDPLLENAGKVLSAVGTVLQAIQPVLVLAPQVMAAKCAVACAAKILGALCKWLNALFGGPRQDGGGGAGGATDGDQQGAGAQDGASVEGAGSGSATAETRARDLVRACRLRAVANAKKAEGRAQTAAEFRKAVEAAIGPAMMQLEGVRAALEESFRLEPYTPVTPGHEGGPR